MTKSRTVLSVRLDDALATALDRHCEATGATRSQVVQQGVAQYLVVQTGPTLGSLAEAVLPPVPKQAASAAARPPRQRRFRDYVREKRRR